MAAPTQEFPPWLTPVPTVVQDPNGALTTSTTVLFLPLTYFGPSIPLGPDWTYGGLTSPPPTSTPTPTSIPLTTSVTTAIPSLTTTATPSSSTSASSLSSSTGSISSSSTVSVTSSSISTSSPAPSQTLAPNNSSHGLTRGQLVGVIVASILGFIFLLVLILAVYLFCKGKNRRRSRAAGPPIDDDYFIVPGDSRVPGEGSPRQSGEERDPFLQERSGPGGGGGGRSEKAGGAGTAYTEMGARPPVPPRVPRVPPPPNTIPSLSSSNSSSTNSGYGEPLAQPTLGIRPIREEHEQEMSGGRILTPEEMQRLDQETVLPPDSDQEPGEDYSGAYAYADAPLLPPPRLVDPASRRTTPDFTLPRPPFSKRPSQASRSSMPLDVDENATLLTARRVRVEDLGPRSSPGSSPVSEEDTSKPSTSFLGSLGALAGRLSWRKSGSPRTSQHQPLLEPSPLSDSDIEQGRTIPPLPQMRERSRPGLLDLGLGPDGTRPISSVSGKSGKSQNSGGTIYHDALSSLPTTPTLSPLPRAATPSDAPASPSMPVPEMRSRPSVPSQLSQTYTAAAPEYEDQAKPTGSPAGTSYTQTLVPNFDILDMPAPSAISLFNSGSAPSLKASMTSDTTIVNNNVVTGSGIRTYPFPPGLELIPTPKTWAEMSNATTPSPGSYAGDQENGVGISIAIDVLEDEPPTAGESWRSIAAAASGGSGAEGERLARRTTFGVPQYVHQPDFTSEQGSLHSMRSHLRPSSPPRSTGSAATSSRRDLSLGSGSSHLSGYSASRSAGGSSGAMSFAQSLARSGSITSDGRRRGFGQISPALSAFGNQLHVTNDSGSGSGSGSGSAFVASREGSSGSVDGPVVQSPSTAYLGPARAASTSSSAMSSPPLTPLNMPWAGGLDESWSASS